MSRIGIEIKVASNTRDSAILLLKKCIEEIENNADNMYFPLNDEDNTEADFSVVDLEEKDLYDDWDECLAVVNPIPEDDNDTANSNSNA